METTDFSKGNTNDDNHGLPDRAVVRQAQKLCSLNPKFWVLIKHFRIPYKIVDGMLVEATYLESIAGLKTPPTAVIYWLLDEEVQNASVSAASMENALKIAEQEKAKLDIFKKD